MDGFGSLIPNAQQLLPKAVTSLTPVTRQGYGDDAVQGVSINPMNWQAMVEAYPPSVNVEDQRNPQQEYYDELWSRARSARARQLSPDERTWLYNYGMARQTNIPERINSAFGSLAPVVSSIRGSR